MEAMSPGPTSKVWMSLQKSILQDQYRKKLRNVETVKCHCPKKGVGVHTYAESGPSRVARLN